LTNPRLGDVRPWLPRPDNVGNFFAGGTTLTTTAAAQQAGTNENFRFSVDRRDSRGIVPNNTLTRQGATFSGEDQPMSGLTVVGYGRVSSDVSRDRPATGFDPSNTIADFARMGRQVDLDPLKNHPKDFIDEQISWNYAGFNNPYFALDDNRNRDDRTRWIGGASVLYALSSTTTASARLGTDHYDQSRDFDIAPTWMGGFPYFA
jgi:hypothetical protein